MFLDAAYNLNIQTSQWENMEHTKRLFISVSTRYARSFSVSIWRKKAKQAFRIPTLFSNILAQTWFCFFFLLGIAEQNHQTQDGGVAETSKNENLVSFYTYLIWSKTKRSLMSKNLNLFLNEWRKEFKQSRWPRWELSRYLISSYTLPK